MEKPKKQDGAATFLLGCVVLGFCVTNYSLCQEKNTIIRLVSRISSLEQASEDHERRIASIEAWMNAEPSYYFCHSPLTPEERQQLGAFLKTPRARANTSWESILRENVVSVESYVELNGANSSTGNDLPEVTN